MRRRSRTFHPRRSVCQAHAALDKLVDAACQTKLYSDGLNNFKAAYTKTAVGIEACVIILEAIHSE